MTAGDRVLIRSQSTATQNGIYLFNGAASAMTRALDADASAKLLNATIGVDEGTDEGTAWRQTAINITIGVTSIAFVAFGTAAPAASTTTPGLIELATQGEVDTGTAPNLAVTPQTLAGWSERPGRYAADVGDGSATQYTVTHNLGSTDVTVEVYANAGNKPTVQVQVERMSTNAVRLTFSSAPASNAYRVVVKF